MPHKIIYVHGWATDSRVWKQTAEKIGGDYVNIDMPSHGADAKWDAPNLLPPLKEIGRQISLAGDKPIVGVGWSLGAQALLQAAHLHKDRFKALILTGATPCFTATPSFPYGQSKNLVRKMLGDMSNNPAKTLDRFYSLNFTAEEKCKKEVVDFMNWYSTKPEKFDYHGITTALNALNNTNLVSLILTMKISALVMHGDHDTITPIEAGRFLAANIGNTAFETIKGAGHAPFISENDRFCELMADFLEKA